MIRIYKIIGQKFFFLYFSISLSLFFLEAFESPFFHTVHLYCKPSALTDLLMVSPPLDLLSPLGLRVSALTSAMLGLLPRFRAALSDSTETAECLRMLYLSEESLEKRFIIEC